MSELSRWHRYRSEHFDVATDLPVADTTGIVRRLERAHATLLRVGFATALESPEIDVGRVRVVWWRDCREIRHFLGPDRGLAFVSRRARQTVFFCGGGEAVSLSTSVHHELTHRFAGALLRRSPRWFDEGLAMFLETMTVSSDAREVRWGGLNARALEFYRRQPRASVQDLQRWTTDADLDTQALWARYATSWLLVQWLHEAHPQLLAGYERRLAEGSGPRQAWGELVAALGPLDLDRELEAYASRGVFRPWQATAPEATQTRLQELPIDEADIHTARAQAALVGAGHDSKRRAELAAEAKRELALALAADPGHPLARHLLASSAPRDAIARLRARVARQPSDGDAWLLLSHLLYGEADYVEAEVALHRAVELEPNDADANNGLAWLLVRVGRAEEALGPAERAAKLGPWSPEVLDTQAAALYGARRCSEALSVQRRAVERTSDAPPALQAELLGRLAAYEQHCGGRRQSPADLPP